MHLQQVPVHRVTGVLHGDAVMAGPARARAVIVSACVPPVTTTMPSGKLVLSPGAEVVLSAAVYRSRVEMARCGGRLGALENRCPHQGGPL